MAASRSAPIALLVAACALATPVAPEIVITNESGRPSDAVLYVDEQPAAQGDIAPGGTVRVPIPAGRTWRLEVGGSRVFDSVEGQQMPRPFDLIVTIHPGGAVNANIRFRPST